MIDSETGRFWNLERAEGAIKGAFFSEEIKPGSSDDDPKLRFTEIRGLIERNERAIGDRTLSRAISSLVAKNQLKKSGVGKGILYALDIPRSERLRAFARSDSTWVTRSADVGGIGDGEKGYAYYGVPEIFRERYRRRLQRAALGHQAEIREILSDAWDDCAEAIVKPSRGRIPRRVWSVGQRATYRMNRLLLLGSLGQGYAARLWEVLEGTIPGALSTCQKTLGVTFAPETPIHDRISIAIAKVVGVSREEIQPEMEKVMKRMARDGQRTRPLWEALTPKEQERAGMQVAATVSMTACLTSVVHV